MLIAVTHGVNTTDGASEGGGADMVSIMGTLVVAEALIALFCTGYLLFAGAGVVNRNEHTCYPIPPEVERRLREGKSLDGMKNLPYTATFPSAPPSRSRG